MTDKLREAAQMALDALQESKPIDIDDPAAFYRSAHAIEALRAALANEFNPDWDAMAVMVEEQQRMAKRIEELEAQLEQPEQEPVAYLCENAVGHKYFRWKKPTSVFKPIPLYTAPPQREWQGLTPEDKRMAGIPLHTGQISMSDAFDVIEKILKEKNT